jgi:hypothetical protein
MSKRWRLLALHVIRFADCRVATTLKVIERLRKRDGFFSIAVLRYRFPVCINYYYYFVFLELPRVVRAVSTYRCLTVGFILILERQ